MNQNFGLQQANQNYANTIAEQTELESILGQISVLAEHASLTEDKVSGLASKLVGENASEKCAATAPKPVRNGILGEIRDQLDLISERLGRADGHISRLRSAI